MKKITVVIEDYISINNKSAFTFIAYVDGESEIVAHSDSPYRALRKLANRMEMMHRYKRNKNNNG